MYRSTSREVSSAAAGLIELPFFLMFYILQNNFQMFRV